VRQIIPLPFASPYNCLYEEERIIRVNHSDDLEKSDFINLQMQEGLSMTIPHTKPGESSLPQAAALMTYAGSLPPIISVIFLWLRPNDYGVDAKAFLILYGGILLTFFGGVRWGVAVMRDSGPNFMNLFGGIWPILVAIPVFFLENNLIRFLIIITVLPLLWRPHLFSLQSRH